MTPFAIGWDPAQLRDWAAGAVCEREDATYLSGTPKPPCILVRHLERSKGKTYPEQVERMEALRDRLGRRAAALVIDATGVGRAVVDLARERRLQPTAITFTGGYNVAGGRVRGGWDFRVPKADLVGTLIRLLHTGQLKVSSALPLANVLVDELADFRVTTSATGHESYAHREGAHDDLLFAVAVAAWELLRPRPQVQFGRLDLFGR